MIDGWDCSFRGLRPAGREENKSSAGQFDRVKKRRLINNEITDTETLLFCTDNVVI